MESRLNLKHFNKTELADMLRNKEQDIEVLINSYFQEIYGFIKKLRQSAKSQDKEMFLRYARKTAVASKSVCFEIMHVLALELEDCDLNSQSKVLDCIDDMENELEIVKDILGR